MGLRLLTIMMRRHNLFLAFLKLNDYLAEMNRIKLFDMIRNRIKGKTDSDYRRFEHTWFRINGWIVVGEKENGNTVLSKGKVILEMCLN